MASNICTICIHPQHAAINDALSIGSPLIPTAAQYGISKSALHRHKINCLAPKLAAAARMVQPEKVTKAPVQRAKAIAAGATPTVEDVLDLTALLDRLARSLDRLENGAISASTENLHAAHAALAGQLHRGIEAAGKLRGYYSDAPAQSGGEKFSISINLPQVAAAPTHHPMIDCTPEPEASAPVPRVPCKNFAVDFALDAGLDDALDAVEALDED